MAEEQKNSSAETVDAATSAAHTVKGAIKAGKAISGAAKGAAAGILPPVWPTLTPRLAIKESIFCDTLRNPIAHINQISTFPETASLPTASTCA